MALIIPTVHPTGIKVKHKSSFNGKPGKSKTTREGEIAVHQKEIHFGVGEKIKPQSACTIDFLPGEGSI